MVMVTDKGFYISSKLKKTLDSYTYNLKKDWDFVICISGGGQTRVGKSVLAQQIGYYMAQNIGTPFDVSNITFSGRELKEKALSSPQYSILIYDEARSALGTDKTMQKVSRDLRDFFAECGQLNHIIILVLPDFFELTKGIALNRSRLLLDVYTNNYIKGVGDNEVLEFKRGFYKVYNKRQKDLLYLRGKREKNYGVVKPHYCDKFNEVYVIDEKAYREKKKISLADNKEEEEKLGKMEKKYRDRTYILLKHLRDDLGYTWAKLSGLLDMDYKNIMAMVRKVEEERIIQERLKLSIKNQKILAKPKSTNFDFNNKENSISHSPDFVEWWEAQKNKEEYL